MGCGLGIGASGRWRLWAQGCAAGCQGAHTQAPFVRAQRCLSCLCLHQPERPAAPLLACACRYVMGQLTQQFQALSQRVIGIEEALRAAGSAELAALLRAVQVGGLLWVCQAAAQGRAAGGEGRNKRRRTA